MLVECLEKLKGIGLCPVCVVCDQGSSNVSFYKRLGITPDRPYFLHGTDKVFALHDPPHLLKNTRTNLEKYNFTSSAHGSKTMGIHTQIL